jgi:ribosomal-protein-alanine N-acetyltransferase
MTTTFDPSTRTLRSKRLEFRPLTDGDVEDLHELFVHPEIRRHLWDDEIVPRSVAADVVAKSQGLFQEQRFGIWGIREIGEKRMIGFGGFWYFYEPPELQLLIGIHPHAWGRGLATEAIRHLVREGFDELGLERIVGATDAPNEASVRLMERAGMHLVDRIPGTKWETLRFAIDKPAARRSPKGA